MNTSSSNKNSKAAILILALLLIGTLFFGYQMHQKNSATELQLQTEKAEVLKNLDNMSSLYGEAISARFRQREMTGNAWRIFLDPGSGAFHLT